MISLWNMASRIGSTIESTLNDSTLRVAVTGLSRAGKTVLITSLVANLLAMKSGRDTLPALRAWLDRGGPNRLRQVRLLPAGAGTMPLFDVMGKLEELASDQPHWPARTEDLAEVELELEIAPAAGMLSGLRVMAGAPRIRLSLLDYPGEWLLDLPMLEQSYRVWSAETLERLRQAPRDAMAAPFLRYVAAINPDAPAEDALLLRGHRLYQEALLACREKLGLRYLQPGRFLCPGPRSEAPFMWFFPIDNAAATPRDGSANALLEARFEAYKTDMRRGFFDTYFRDFDRQIVLVDVLGALHAGKVAYEDTERAIGDIAASLTARDGWLGGLLGGARVERVAFVATKADHVPELQRENLRALLRDMARPARAHGPAAEDAVSYHVAASIVSTTDGWAERASRHREPVVWGRELGHEERRAYHVGAVPISRPPEGFWSGRYFELPVFTPPPIDPGGSHGIHHLGLDQILVDLIGDRL
ncbi:MAG: YcjX family protein [Acetobacteraceae bacterium]